MIHVNLIGEVAELTRPGESYTQIGTKANPDLIWSACDDVFGVFVFTGRILPASEGAAMGLVTKLSNTPVDDAMAMAREIAGRSPDTVRGTKKLINRLSNAGAADHFVAEREIIFKLIGSANQVEAITANF